MFIMCSLSAGENRAVSFASVSKAALADGHPVAVQVFHAHHVQPEKIGQGRLHRCERPP